MTSKYEELDEQISLDHDHAESPEQEIDLKSAQLINLQVMNVPEPSSDGKVNYNSMIPRDEGTEIGETSSIPRRGRGKGQNP